MRCKRMWTAHIAAARIVRAIASCERVLSGRLSKSKCQLYMQVYQYVHRSTVHHISCAESPESKIRARQYVRATTQRNVWLC